MPLQGGQYGWEPQDLWNAYRLPAPAAGLGTGKTVAVVDAWDNPNAESDLATYRSRFGLSACTSGNGCFRKIDQTGGVSYPSPAPANSNWAAESSADIEMVSATCPNCKIILVEANSNSLGDLLAAVDEAVAQSPNAVSMSWGGPEFAGETSLDGHFQHAGVAFFAASGDSGYGTTIYPSASPDVFSVGGTTLAEHNTDGSYYETAWAGSTSGCSPYEPKPIYQSDLGCGMRTAADVAADAGSAVSVYSTYPSNVWQSGWTGGGGTSVSTPMVAGMAMLTTGAQALTAGPSTWYGLPSGPFSITDITSGSTGSCGTYLCNAQAGYDGPTGLGSPRGPQPPALLPSVTTGQASGITASAATLSGSVDSNGQTITNCHFDYDTSANYYPVGNYGLSAPCDQAASSITGPTGVTAQLSGLQANQTYHYRIVATSSAGTRFGYDYTFTTGAVQPPTVTTAAASGVTRSTATLNGTVNPQGLTVTDCHFEYDTSLPYQLVVPCAQAPGSGSSPVAVSAQLTGLFAGRLYHFRLVAGTSGGTTAGTDHTFISELAPPPPYGGTGPGSGSQCADPITCSDGNFFETTTDLALPGLGRSLSFQRTYNAQLAATETAPDALGWGWTDAYAMSVSTDPNTGYVTVHQENGSMVTFMPSTTGYHAPAWVTATLVKNTDGSLTYTLPDQRSDTFDAGGRLISESDRNGYQTALTYTSGRLSSVTDPSGRALTLSYNGAGQLVTVADPSGTVTYAYDAAGHLTSVTDAAGDITQYGYDSAHRLTTITDPNGGTTTNVYDSENRVTSQTDPVGGVTSLSYGPGPTTTIIDPNGDTTVETFNADYMITSRTIAHGTADQATWTYSYDSQTDELTGMTNPAGKSWTYAYDAHGNRTATTDPLGRTTTTNYNAHNEPLTVTDPNGETTTYAYDLQGNVTHVTRPLAGTGQVADTTFTYDTTHPGEAITITDPAGVSQQLSYDRYGNLIAKTDGAGDKATYGYDQAGNLTSTVSPRGNASGANPNDYTTTIVRDLIGRPTKITDPLGHITRMAYDAGGNKIAVTDPNNNQTRYAYDKLGRLTAITRPDGTQLKIGYDADSNRTSSIDGLGHITRYYYNARNELIKQTDPLGRSTTFGYDTLGNRTSTTDANGKTTTYGYDAARELTSITYNDPHTPDVTYSYDPDGRRIKMTDGTGPTTYSYDSLGRLTSETSQQILIGAAGTNLTFAQTVTYSYDLAGRLTSIGYPGIPPTVSTSPAGLALPSISRSYDAAGRLRTITDFSGGLITYAYDADSNNSAISYPNGTNSVLTYDAVDRLTRTTASGPTGTILDLPYTRDSNGQITSAPATSLTSAVTENYNYNSLGQLTDATSPSTAGTPVSADHYAYDAADRITALAPLGVAVSGQYDAADQLGGITDPRTGTVLASYSYDQNGNRTQTTNPGTSARASYTYDQANRLIAYRGPTGGVAATAATTAGAPTTSIAPTDATYQYNGDGLRADLLWDQTQGVPVVLADGSHNYITGPDGFPVEQINAAGQVRYYLHDQLGSTRALTDQHGATLALYDFDPYGNIIRHTGTITDNPFGYAGQYTDSATGLIYMRARYYDPATAQFLTVDPLSAETDEPYAYAADSPINALDPTGLSTEGYCASVTLQLGVVSPTAQGCITQTDSGAAGFTVMLGASAGVNVQVINAATILEQVQTQLLNIIKSFSVPTQFEYETSNASDLCQLGKWFDYATSSFTAGLPWPLSDVVPNITGSDTTFSGGGVQGTTVGVGVAFGASGGIGLGTTVGKSYTWVFPMTGAIADAISTAINGLDVLTWPARQAVALLP